MSVIDSPEGTANMAVLATSIEPMIDTLVEGIEEIANRLGLTEAQTLTVCKTFSTDLEDWVTDQYAESDTIDQACNQ